MSRPQNPMPTSKEPILAEKINFDSTSFQPQIILNLNLNSTWLWHKSNPILLYIKLLKFRDDPIGPTYQKANTYEDDDFAEDEVIWIN